MGVMGGESSENENSEVNRVGFLDDFDNNNVEYTVR